MKKALILYLIGQIYFFSFLIQPKPIYAAANGQCSDAFVTLDYVTASNTPGAAINEITTAQKVYYVFILKPLITIKDGTGKDIVFNIYGDNKISQDYKANQSGSMIHTVNGDSHQIDGYIDSWAQYTIGNHVIHLRREGDQQDLCSINYTVVNPPTPTPNISTCTISVEPSNPSVINPITKMSVSIPHLPKADEGFSTFTSRVGDISIINTTTNNSYYHTQSNPSKDEQTNYVQSFTDSVSFTTPGSFRIEYTVVDISTLAGDTPTTTTTNIASCKTNLQIGDTTGSATTPTLSPQPTIPAYCSTALCGSCNDPTVTVNALCNACPQCPNYGTPKVSATVETLCKSATVGTSNLQSCLDCANKGGIWSAIGCLPTDISDFISKYLFTYGIGIIGGVAFLYLLYGCFLILTSSGNPEQVTQAKEIITSSLMGLLLAIFSVLILRIISVDILRLPEFGPAAPTSIPTSPPQHSPGR